MGAKSCDEKTDPPTLFLIENAASAAFIVSAENVLFSGYFSVAFYSILPHA
jgi:hypothetical protein